MVQLVLVPLALRDFYRHVELHGRSVTHGDPQQSAGRHFWGVGTIASSGSTIVTAKTGRFRRRLTIGVIGLVLLLIGGGVGVGVFLAEGGGHDASNAVAIPEAKLPDLGEPSPVLGSLATDAPVPDPTVLSGR